MAKRLVLAAFQHLAAGVGSGHALVGLQHVADRHLEARAGDAAHHFALIGGIEPGQTRHVRGGEFASVRRHTDGVDRLDDIGVLHPALLGGLDGGNVAAAIINRDVFVRAAAGINDDVAVGAGIRAGARHGLCEGRGFRRIAAAFVDHDRLVDVDVLVDRDVLRIVDILGDIDVLVDGHRFVDVDVLVDGDRLVDVDILVDGDGLVDGHRLLARAAAAAGLAAVIAVVGAAAGQGRGRGNRHHGGAGQRCGNEGETPARHAIAPSLRPFYVSRTRKIARTWNKP